MRQAITTLGAPGAIGPYSQAIVAGDWVWLSGQIALDATSGKLVGESAAEQAQQVMKNLGAVLEAAGCGFADVVQCTIFLTDLEDFASVNTVYAQFVSDPPPARATVEVSRLPRDVRVEVSAVAYRGGR